MAPATSPSPLAARLPPLIMGGAGFSYQLHPSPESLPVLSIVSKAFALGLRAIDTSPYYEPSEQLLGAALSSPEITLNYSRDAYILMTKVGRISENHFDYSPEWVRKSVARSLHRFQTDYLDVVFAHDVEFVTPAQAVEAVGTLFALADQGCIRAVGISGYEIDALVHIARLVREQYGRPVDVVQNWAQLTLQNTQLEKRGLALLRAAGVKAVCNSSPLASGLLRTGGVPLGSKGDWHPAPRGLRAVAQKAADAVEQSGEKLSSVALRFAISRAMRCSKQDMVVRTITGIGNSTDLEENLATARAILRPPTSQRRDSGGLSFDMFTKLDEEAERRDLPLYGMVRQTLGEWVDFDFSNPSKESTQKLESFQVPALASEKEGIAEQQVIQLGHSTRGKLEPRL